MHLFYALGGGWGHLARVRAFVQQEQLREYRVLTANPAAENVFSPKHLAFLPLDRSTTAEELARSLQPYVADCSHWYVDTFPSGILGELPQVAIPSHCTKTLLARRLRWAAYAPLLAPDTHYHRAYLFEAPHPQQQIWLAAHCPQVDSYTLLPDSPNSDRVAPLLTNLPRPWWLVVHTQPLAEVQALVDFAQAAARREGFRPSLVALTEQSPKISHGMVRLDSNPLDWFPLVDRIYCGGGFNTLLALRPYAAKVRALPFPRRFDDQAERIRRMLPPQS